MQFKLKKELGVRWRADESENPCKWCVNAICLGFLILYIGFSFLDTVTIYRYNQ
jgi:hypothetical protein